MRFDEGRPLEIDIYLPELHLGFEYQEQHHYFTSHYGTTTLAEYQERHKRKKERNLRNKKYYVDHCSLLVEF